MKISLKWLNELIDTALVSEDIVSKLTDLGLECSESEIGPSFSSVFIGKVESVSKHTNSDHLSVCKVNIGAEDYLDIVCGAPNIKENIYVPVAVVGASLGNGSFIIKNTKIRGEESQGMICSEKELGLSENHDGIMILDKESNLGTPFEDFLGLEKDIIIEFDLTPNRGDCLSLLGIAREVAILESKNPTLLTKEVIKANSFKIVTNDISIHDSISVKIEDKESCPLYLGQIIKEVKIKDSPQWLKDKLNSLGMKSINIIVDLANYVMLTLGQPMHTFDFDKLPTKKINVGFPSSKKTIHTLDSEERELCDHNLLIKDEQTPIAIAGVIGGKNTEVDKNTKNIFIESALFNPIVIRKSAKSIDISTDASKRYERSVDPAMARIAIEVLTGLIIKYAGGTACKDLLECGKEVKNNNTIEFDVDQCNRFLGTNLDHKEIEDIFNKVNIIFNKKGKVYHCIAPTYRMHDIERDVDLYEEVARVVGFNNIDNSKSFSIDYAMISEQRFDLIDSVKNILSSNGFFEHYSNSLVSDREHAYFSESSGICLSNPLNKNMQYIRNSIAPGILRAILFNQKRKNKNYKLFEVGATYQNLNENPPIEDMCLGLAWPVIQFDHWKDKGKYDFFDSKSDIDSFLDSLNILAHEYCEIEKKGFKVCYGIKVQNLEIGCIGILDDKILKSAKIKEDLIYAEISLIKLKRVLLKKQNFKEPSVYPSSVRDISVLVSNEYSSKKLIDTIKKAGGKILNAVYLFDVYADNSFNKGMKSYAFKMVFQSKIETLKDSEVDIIMEKIMSKLKSAYNVIQR
tara:strand:+ start:905 stop:3304 length:2400 start_codon:yes stop_codon:yes gene_type:complete